MSVKDYFIEILENIRDDKTPQKETVRSLLNRFGSKKRGVLVVEEIRDFLDSVDLYTEPDFSSAYIDAEVEYKIQSNLYEEGDLTIFNDSHSVQKTPINDVPDRIYKELIPTIGSLKSANTVPISVKRDSKTNEAITVMLMHDYSQLPVMQSEREVNGLISWKSIGAARAMGREFEFVRDCMESKIDIIEYDMPLVVAVSIVAEREVVLVKNKENKITGLVTASDISYQFIDLSQPFLLLGEIENHVRRVIHHSFSNEDIKNAKDPRDEKRKIETVDDLTFGEYQRMFELESNWLKLKYQLSKAVFTKYMEKIRIIRNEVMHFNPDGISIEDVKLLKDALAFIKMM